MAPLLQALTIRECEASAHAGLISRIPGDDPTIHADYFAAEVRAGRAQVAELVRSGECVGVIVWRTEGEACVELVIMGLIATASVNLQSEIMDVLRTLAARENARSIRFHTVRPGLIRQMTACGFRVSEAVLRLTL